MSNNYIKRSLEPALKKAVTEFPAVVLTGPRQSGKTTLLKYLFGKQYRYVSLELPDIQMAAEEDPRSFLEMYPSPVMFDEIQYAPGLLPFIKEKIDARRHDKGQFLLSGSQNILLMERVTESLAGRAAMLSLLPLSRRETEGRPTLSLPWESAPETPAEKRFTYMELWQSFIRGGYPEPVVEPERDINLWYASYVQTYLERDLRALRQIGDLSQFRIFLRILAARSAQLLNLTDVSRDIGVAVNTLKAWLSVLEATYQIIVLRPYFANVGKRFVKTPKVYFTDVGTLCYLAGLKDPAHAASGPLGGAILETAVLSEIIKTITHRGIQPHIYFWRTTAGTEVDFVIEREGKIVPLEVKLSATPGKSMASSIKILRKDLGDKALPGLVVHPGDILLPLGKDITALPFASL